MAKGRYIKSAERACAAKTRFETALDAERASEWRYRAYQCPVCHGFHLTSQAGSFATTPDPPAPPKPKEPEPKLRDLDWSAALDPQPRPARPAKPKKPRLERPAPPPSRSAMCIEGAKKDHRVRLVLEGAIVKSSPVRDPSLRAKLAPRVRVRVSTNNPPEIVSLED